MISLRFCSNVLASNKIHMTLDLQEWDAPETKSGMDIAVTALEGSGSYHLQAEII
eukprot:SAG22_NODE_3520_length_1664_cov_5.713099_1_plen_54_part_10